MLYLLLFAVCIAVELSEKVNTDNLFKKVAIGFIAVGALFGLAGKTTVFIDIGILLYLTANLCTAHLVNPKRRSVDK